MPVDEAPDDDDFRQSFNFAPGYHGLVYRADVPDHGASSNDRADVEPQTNDHAPGEADEELDTTTDQESVNYFSNDEGVKPSDKTH